MRGLKNLSTLGLLLIFSCEVSKQFTDKETKEDFVKFKDELEFQVNLYKDADSYNKEVNYLVVGLDINQIKDTYIVDSLDIKLFDSEIKVFPLNRIEAFYLTKDSINKSRFDPWVITRYKELSDSSKTLNKKMTEGFNYNYFFKVNDTDTHKTYLVQLFALISREGKTITLKKNIFFKRHTQLLPLKLGC